MIDKTKPLDILLSPCKDHWSCPNFREKDGDLSMDYEHYECKVCGKRDKLDYEEMR